jgi:hypothetical protein
MWLWAYSVIMLLLSMEKQYEQRGMRAQTEILTAPSAMLATPFLVPRYMRFYTFSNPQCTSDILLHLTRQRAGPLLSGKYSNRY